MATLSDPIIIGVDTGNKMLKTASTAFLSSLKKLDEPPPIMPIDAMDVIRYNKTYYMVSTDRLSYSRDKTLNDDFLILTLIGIAKELRQRCIHPQGTRIILSLGLPPGHLKGGLVERYQEYFGRNNGTFHFECGSVQHHIFVDHIIVNPQGLACIIANDRHLLKKTMLQLLILADTRPTSFI